MNTPFSYQTSYVLDKSHFSETFDQSHDPSKTRGAYTKAAIITLLGAVFVLFTDFNGYIAWFIVAVGVIEALNVRFKKAWWLARQMLSRAANSEVTLTIDEEAIHSKSYYLQSRVMWPAIKRIEPTPMGWLLHHNQSTTYLSKRVLSEAAQQFVSDKAEGLRAS